MFNLFFWPFWWHTSAPMVHPCLPPLFSTDLNSFWCVLECSRTQQRLICERYSFSLTFSACGHVCLSTRQVVSIPLVETCMETLVFFFIYFPPNHRYYHEAIVWQEQKLVAKCKDINISILCFLRVVSRFCHDSSRGKCQSLSTFI